MTSGNPGLGSAPGCAFAYEFLRPVTEFAAVILADNPHPMTLEGTNTWLLRAPGSSSAIVVDPGPDDEAHLDAVIAGCGQVATILLTHGHLDHSAGARRLHERTGAGVRCIDPQFRFGAQGLREGDVVAAAGVEVRVWATPGHSSDSLCFLMDSGDSTASAVLTGDTILGRGTTLVAYPDGDLRDYLASLTRLQSLGAATVLPGHGPELLDAGAAATAYLAHRDQRLMQVRAALAELRVSADRGDSADVAHGAGPMAAEIVKLVYADVDRALWPAAELSVRAQLAYLARPDL